MKLKGNGKFNFNLNGRTWGCSSSLLSSNPRSVLLGRSEKVWPEVAELNDKVEFLEELQREDVSRLGQVNQLEGFCTLKKRHFTRVVVLRLRHYVWLWQMLISTIFITDIVCLKWSSGLYHSHSVAVFLFQSLYLYCQFYYSRSLTMLNAEGIAPVDSVRHCIQQKGKIQPWLL